MQRRTKAWLTSYRWKVPGRSQPPTVAATPPAPAAAVPVHAVQQEPRLGPGPSADGVCGRPRGFVHFAGPILTSFANSREPQQGSPSTCASSAALAEAVARLETWLIKTRGAELRKVKSSAAALRAVAHVAYAHARCDEEAAQMSGDCTATRRPSEAAVRIELPSEAFVGEERPLCASPARRTQQRAPHSRPRGQPWRS